MSQPNSKLCVALVDRLAEINARIISEWIDRSVIQSLVIAMYEKVAAEGYMKKR